jgi:hypothetical protein
MSEIRDDKDRGSKTWDGENEGKDGELGHDEHEDKDREVAADEEIAMTQTENDEAAQFGHAGDGGSVQRQAEHDRISNRGV